MATEERKRDEDRDFVFCGICGINHRDGRKHLYSKRHRTKLNNILDRFSLKITEILPQLKTPQVVDGMIAENRLFWCHFCSSEVAKHQIQSNVSVNLASAFEHLSSKSHKINTASFFKLNGADKALKKKFTIKQTDYKEFCEKAETLKKQILTMQEAKRLEAAKDLAAQSEERQNIISQSIQESQTPRVTVYKTVTNSLGIFQNPTGWHEGTRVWGGGIVKHKSGSDQWIPWEIDKIDSLGETSSSNKKKAISKSNVHTGAVPPWLMNDSAEDNDTKSLQADLRVEKEPSVPIGPSEEDFKRNEVLKSKRKLNPNRVGANFDHNTETRDDWLPSFGGVWNAGPRWHTRANFKTDQKKRKK